MKEALTQFALEFEEAHQQELVGPVNEAVGLCEETSL